MDTRYGRDEASHRSSERGGKGFNAGVTAPPSDVIGVFGLSPSTTEADLEKVFAAYGALKSCTLVFDKRAQVSRGFGFVTFQSVDDAKVAVDATKDGQLSLQGRQVRVDFSKTRGAHDPTPGRYMGRDVDRPRPSYRDDYRGRRYDDRDRYDRRDDRRDYDRPRSYDRRHDDGYDRDRRYDDRYAGSVDRGYDRRSSPRRYY